MNTKNLSTLKIHKLTQAQYERELAAGRIDENALYLTPDDGYSRDDLDVILAGKSDVGHTHSISNIDNLQETLDGHDIAIDELNEEVSIDYSQIAFDTGSKYEDDGIDFSVYQTKADGTLSTTAKTVSGAINELDAGIDNEASLRTAADTELDNKIAQISNPNLLINSDFRNPINQRGQTRYTRGSSDTYTIDRWVLNYATVLDVLDGCVQLTGGSANNCYWLQYFETHLSGTFTVSFNVLEVTGDMKFHILDGATPHNVLTIVPGINTATFTVSDLVRIGFCALKTGAVAKIEWIKLEQGSIATPFVPRSYGEELALCQRYYWRINDNQLGMFMPAMPVSDTKMRLLLHVGNTLRTTPTVSQQGLNYIDHSTTGWVKPNSVSVFMSNEKYVVLDLTFSSAILTNLKLSDVIFYDGYIALDAEIY